MRDWLANRVNRITILKANHRLVSLPAFLHSNSRFHPQAEIRDKSENPFG
jgi:hypothetical protein